MRFFYWWSKISFCFLLNLILQKDKRATEGTSNFKSNYLFLF